MFLVVSIDDFVETVKRHDPRTMSRTVYRHSASLPGTGGGSGAFGGSTGPTGYLLRLTYGNPEINLIVVAETLVGTQQEIGDMDYKMKQDGITIVSGMWTDGASLSAPAGQQAPAAGPNGQFWVAAVAYNSADDEPGVWMDAFPTQPEEDEVLHAMFDEFVSSGDLADVSYEDFVSEAAPTVQVVAARDVQQWLRKRS